MKKAKRVLIAVVVILLVIVLTMFINVYFCFLHHYTGKYVNNPWKEDDIFEINKITTLEKKKDKDFVILNLADVQMCDLENFFDKRKLHNELTYLVKTYKPDLITLTGDQTWSNENLICLTSLISWLDEYHIPYAPIFGNHDHGNKFSSATAGLNYCCQLYEEGKYSLFNRGPTNIDSLGNYVINIKEEDRIINTLYMMDLGYNDEINESQLKWFKWNAEGIKENNNNICPYGICFTHKELPQYKKAYQYYLNVDPSIAEGRVTVHMGFDHVKETGFAALSQSYNVKDYVCGHEHYNNFTLNYQGARYTFTLKTGEFGGCYKDDSIYLNGATIIRLNNEKPVIEHQLVNRDIWKR